MEQKNMKKKYCPLSIRFTVFETEDVLAGSNGGFHGDEEDLMNVNSDARSGIRNQVNPS